MKKSVRFTLAAIITLVVGALAYYMVLPPLNVASPMLWLSITFLAAVFGVVYLLLTLKGGVMSAFKGTKLKGEKKKTGFILWIGVTALPVAVILIGMLLSSTFFNAKKYSEIVTVPEADFADFIPETDVVTNISLMDSESANILGNRALGALSEVVSQYQVNGTYSQINYLGAPQKISNLEYVDFFKWLNNRENGVPGYIMVDPVNSNAKYVPLSESMRYVDSAYFHEDLHRKLRFSYPTKIFGSYTFELDEEGNPYYVVSCMAPRVGLFGAMDVSEVIVFNPCNGEHQLYSLEETPAWIDNVFTGALSAQKYDWYGMLKNGYWNSVIGNKDCKVTTDDFGYIVLGDDVWFYTGVTSISSDESNIGFIISNARTGEYKFFSVIGAEEYSAMGAAEGEVQEKGYEASFPSLINVSGQPTYIMVLKDANSIVKMHALVNVENYSIVATGTTQTEAKQAYVELLKEEGIIEDEPEPEEEIQKHAVEITVSERQLVTVSGESVLYLTGDDGNLYKQEISADEKLLLIQNGQKLEIEYSETATDKVRKIVSWSIKTTK